MAILSQLIVNGIIAGSIYALIAIGFSLIYSILKILHIAHGSIYMVSAFIAYTLTVILSMNFMIAFLITLLASAILGILIDRTVYRPLRKIKAQPIATFIASIGLFIFFESLILLIYGADIKTLRTGPIQKGQEIFGAIITPTQITILITAVVLMLFLWLFIKYTRIGKAIRATADNKDIASVVGINTEKIIMVAFAIGSMLAAAAGILVALEQNLEPTMGFTAIVKALTASIVGGIGSIPGALIGGYFIGMAENLGIWFLPSGYKDAIAFAILIIFLIFKPEGILGVKEEAEKI